MTPWVAVLNISPRTAQKIIERHHLHPNEIRDAIVCVKGLVGVWDDDPERGLRLIVETRIKRRRVLVVLYLRRMIRPRKPGTLEVRTHLRDTGVIGKREAALTDMDSDDFYEDDEPIAKIVAAFERGEKVLTGGGLSNGQTVYLNVLVPADRQATFAEPSTRLYHAPLQHGA